MSDGSAGRTETPPRRAVIEDFDAVLAAARAGDPSAWSLIHRRFAPLIVGYLRGQSLPDPEDVAGEVFLQLVRDITSFSGSEERFRSWLLTIAHHRMLDTRRRMQRRPLVTVPSEDLDPGPDDTIDLQASIEADDGWRRLQRHLDALTDDQREVVTLRVVGELTLEETAQVMRRRVGAIKALQHRAFAALRERLAAERAGSAHTSVPVRSSTAPVTAHVS